jgi:glycosyltransferase involved in cell wall biosynthesis
MRIGIDARFLTHPQVGGFRTYTQNLLKALAEVDQENEYFLYTNGIYTETFLFPDRFSLRPLIERLPAIGMAWREQVLLPRQIKKDRLDLFHALALTAPLQAACPTVITLHDMIWRRPSVPGQKRVSFKRALMNRYYRTVPERASARAAAIITVSQAARQDILHSLAISSEKVFVTSEAASSLFRVVDPSRCAADVAAHYGLKPGYLFALGSADPRKNVQGLLESYAGLSLGLREAHPLAIVWANPSLADDLAQTARRLGIDKQLHYLQNVNDEEMVSLYNAAAAFAFPSLYEGFGLPLLEAMACGTPVITADNSSLPEIAGDAAWQVGAEDRAGWVQALTQVLTDETLRERMRRQGLQRASEFTWHRCAQETLDAYRAASKTQSFLREQRA